MSNDKDTKVQSAAEYGKESAKDVKKINDDVEEASKIAAKNLEGKTKEPFNLTDSALDQTDHYKDLREVQARSLGFEYDEKNDPELHPEVNTLEVPTPSSSQNNLKHPDTPEYTDPHMSKNYLGQPI